MNLRRKLSSQESQMATRNTEPIVNSSETLSLDPFYRQFRTGWSHCESQRRIPIDRITSSRAHCLARNSSSSGHPLSASCFLIPFQRPLLGVPRVRQTVSSRGVIPNPNKLHFVNRCACSCLIVACLTQSSICNAERFEKLFRFFLFFFF